MLSNVEDRKADYHSNAMVEIKRITFLGTTVGGASDCIPVPRGWYSPARSVLPSKCEPGFNQMKVNLAVYHVAKENSIQVRVDSVDSAQQILTPQVIVPSVIATTP